MTFPPSTLWDCFGSLDSLGYEEMKLPISLQETEQFTILLDQSWPWQFLDRIGGKR